MITEEIRAVLSVKADTLLRRSADHMAALLHPEFVYVNAGGYKLDKAQYIDNGCTSGRVVFRSQGGQKVSELDVHQLGDVAVATKVLHDQFAPEGREIIAAYKSLRVFTNKAGHWLWVAGQTMRPSLS